MRVGGLRSTGQVTADRSKVLVQVCSDGATGLVQLLEEHRRIPLWVAPASLLRAETQNEAPSLMAGGFAAALKASF